MAAKASELLVLERMAAALDELVTVNKKILKELRDSEEKQPVVPQARRY